ncbi:MAG: glycosyltransferase family 2 protein [Firmicutes bacterium]|nr:glycosyltransferase family 2 protein [Bacillota bacterium]
MSTLDNVMVILLVVVALMGAHGLLFQVIGLLMPARKFKETENKYKYCFLIPASNEESVIAASIQSIKAQDYPEELITIFLVADNCTDKTAENARAAGAIVYEKTCRNPRGLRRKGFALKYLVECIKRDYPDGIETWDGCFILDADNVIAPTYVTEYNKAFDNKRYDFFNAYVNSSNFASNFIASASGISIMGGNTNSARPMGVLGISQVLRGRGSLYRSYLLANGFKWTGLTEDSESGAYLISRGYRGTYCEAAELFEEQPITAKIFFRQRLRWTRGSFIAWLKYCFPFLIGIFLPRDWRKNKPKTYVKRKQTFFDGLLKRLSCWVNFCRMFPTNVLTFMISFVYPITVGIIAAVRPGDTNITTMLIVVGLYYVSSYFGALARNFVIIVREHKRLRIKPRQVMKTMWLWPLFGILMRYVRLYALVVPVGWKKIPHVEDRTIDDVLADKTLGDAVDVQVEKFKSRNKKDAKPTMDDVLDDDQEPDTKIEGGENNVT